jgi:peptidoglycan-associated lipoprotein
MVAMDKMVWCGFMTILIFTALGCAPSASSKPDLSVATPDKSTEKQPGEGRSLTKESTAQPGSSLDDLREGKPPATGPLKDIFFGFDRYDLEAEARSTLKANADWLKKNPAGRVEIEGHCDERGTNEYNLALGAKRAQAAKDYLVTLGIATERLSTISYGEEIPVCKEPNESCWRQNRRARFVIIPSRPAS